MNHFNQFSKMFTAQLKMTLREKQAWFWGIFFPIILMVIFMVIFSDSNNEFKAKVAVVDPAPNETSAQLWNAMKDLPVFAVEQDEPISREEAEKLVADKDVDAMIVLPETENGSEVRLIVNKEREQHSTTQMISGVLGGILQNMNLALAGAEPKFSLSFDAISSGSDDLEYKDFLLTGMIALSIAQGGLFGMVDLVEMRRKGLLTRLRMTPARMGLFGFSDMAMRMVFAVVQLLALSLIGVFVFGATLHIHFLVLLIVFLIGVLSFNALGYLFSSFSKTTEAYMGMANIASFLMMFLSGVFFPVEGMPGWLQPVAHVSPLTYFVEGLRDSMVYARGLTSSSFWFGIGVLVLWGVGAFALGSLLYRNRSLAATR